MRSRYSVTLSFLLLLPFAGAQVTLNPMASGALGAARLEPVGSLTNIQPNLVEGRELNGPQGVALDLNVTPPHLYVADTLNNRVLGWKDSTKFANGAFADIVIGQNDLFTTVPQGPSVQGSSRPASGFTTPSGLAVDAKGNLYVVDGGNNRILRFPAPFAQAAGQLFPDMAIGQPGFATSAANNGNISASTLQFSTKSGTLTAYLKFDPNGNLWVADVGNQRVLEYKASDLAKGNSGPAAVLVLGQPDFVSNSLGLIYDSTSTTTLNYPTGIAFDSAGRLYVSESQPANLTRLSLAPIRSRILVYQPPFTSSMPALRVIGDSSVSPEPPIAQDQFANGAGDVAIVSDKLAVIDTPNNRVLVFPPFSQFTSDLLTQVALAVIGQPDFNSGMVNRGHPNANFDTLHTPADAAFAPGSQSIPEDPAGELYIADTGNNRVVVVPVTPNSSTLGFNGAVRLLGQQTYAEQAPNYIEGREFHFADSSGAGDGGIALDNTSNPPHLYVADTYNNRILCFADYRTLTTGSAASFAIGQPDLYRALVNFPSGDPKMPGAQGLAQPTGLAVDSATGDLYVADTGNSRVLRFKAPFQQPAGLPQTADVVLGQADFVSKSTDVSASTMATPYGLTFVPGIGLLVSDTTDNRVMLFPSNNLKSGVPSTRIWGQINPTSIVASSTDNRFNKPQSVAVDSARRLYVADTGNGRVLIFGDILQQTINDPHSIFSIPGIASPRSVIITPASKADPADPADQIWIGDSSRAFRFSGGYNSLVNVLTFTPDLVVPESTVLSLAIDQYGSLYVADAANRVVIHHPGIAALNGASFSLSRQTVAPNTILSLFTQGAPFVSATRTFTGLPLPTSLLSIQAQLNGTPLPLYYVSPNQINLLIPNNAPTTGTAKLQVVRTDTGQVLGDTFLTMTNVAPGLFTSNGSGKGQVAAINQDGTPNNSSNPIPRGSVLQVYGTGIGHIAAAPNDGSAVNGPTPTTEATTATINGVPCPVQYSGLAPGLVGVWQINVQISQSVVPTGTLADRISSLVVHLASAPSNDAVTSVWVK